MIDRQGRIIQMQSSLLGWFQRWATFCVAGVGYLFSLFLVQRTLVGLLGMRERIASLHG